MGTQPRTAEGFNLADFEKYLREADLKALDAFKAGRGEAPTIYKAEGAAKAEREGGLQVFVASEESPDRMGDVISVAGWDFKHFKRNPVLMFGHDYRTAPVGIVPKLWVDGKQLLNTVRWDTDDPLAAFLAGKYERGFMRAESVGFRSLEAEPVDGKDPWNGVRFLKQELLEISAVPIPAHPAALKKAMGERHFSIVMPGLAAASAEPEGESADGAVTARLEAVAAALTEAATVIKDGLAALSARPAPVVVFDETPESDKTPASVGEPAVGEEDAALAGLVASLKTLTQEG